MKNIPACLFLTLSLLTVSSISHATEYFCPVMGDTYNLHVRYVGYDVRNYYPTISFVEGSGWSNDIFLSKNQGINTDYGKALYAIALSAQSTGSSVTVHCESGVGITGLYLYK